MNGLAYRTKSGWFKAHVMLVAVLFTAASDADEIKVEGRTFSVPAGFTVERIAGPPLVDRPITAAFDDDGRLYAADSSGSNENVKKQLEEKPHRIVRLEDSDGDGKFDKRTIFADKMMFPAGSMWHGGSLYVAAPPSIWKLTDTNGDGVADIRTEWFAGKTLTGCANDLHGPYLGPDGWIYWCKGAFAEQKYERSGRPPFVTRAAHIFRSRPDGSQIEPVMTGGMDNPVDIAFTPGGERVFTTTFLVNPSGGQRDGLIHAIYGGIYGKVHDKIFDPSHKWTGPEVMPVLLHMGPAAPCGLTRYESDAFGTSYQDNLFACYFNLHKVSRHILGPRGATFATADQEFLSSPDLDFHPTDVIEDADGSLVIVDTGGWYKLCCPTSQLHKPDVLGAIYRVRKTGRTSDGIPQRINDPRGLELTWSTMTVPELVKLLGDRRPAVQSRAIAEVAKKGPDAVPALRRVVQAGGYLTARRNAVWAATRIDAPDARAVARSGLSDPDPSVRLASLHAIALWRDREAVKWLIPIVKSAAFYTEPSSVRKPSQSYHDSLAMHERRVAAEALGRIGDNKAVPALLEAAGQTDDRILGHSLTYALIEIGDPKGTKQGLLSLNPRTLRSAMVALDQMDGGSLDPKWVAELLVSADPALKEGASWIVGRHPEWAPALAGVLGERLMRIDLSNGERTELERQLGRFAQAAPIERLLSATLRDSFAPLVARQSSLQAMAWSNLKPEAVPRGWLEALASVLEGDPATPDLKSQAIATLRALPVSDGAAGDLFDRLLRIAGDPDNAADIRLSALAAVGGRLVDPSETLFAFLLGRLDRDQSVAARTTAADVLARAKLTTSQLTRLADALRVAGPLEVDRLLVAFEQSTDQSLGLKVIEALTASRAVASLRVESIKGHIAKYGPQVQNRAEALYDKLNANGAKEKARLEQLMGALSAGDVRRGQLVFHSEKAACYSCHSIGYRGGNVGPDLTRIGAIRAQRDLLEAIVFPSASLVRSFEPITVATSDGKLVNGLLRGENADELILATGVNQEARIARRDIEEMRPGTVSVMPAGLDQQLTTQELADLVAFLKACQ